MNFVAAYNILSNTNLFWAWNIIGILFSFYAFKT